MFNKLGIKVAERLKTLGLKNLGEIREISNLGEYIAQCPVPIPETKPPQQQPKNMQTLLKRSVRDRGPNQIIRNNHSIEVSIQYNTNSLQS